MLVSTQPANFSLLQAGLPGMGLTTLGVMLEDPANDGLYLKLRRDLREIAVAEEDAEVLELLADDLDSKAREMGAAQLFAYLEGSLSNTLRVTDREPIIVDDFDRALNRLYRANVQSTVLEFRTHLPKYSLRVAAGKFLDNAEVEAEDWIEAPKDLRLAPGMFVAGIVGRSMEPVIPDGSLCVFLSGVTGSRNGRRVLVMQTGAAGVDAFSVKVYRSEKTPAEEESWRHESILLESLNPDYPSWRLDADEEKYKIIAEFVRVLM